MRVGQLETLLITLNDSAWYGPVLNFCCRPLVFDTFLFFDFLFDSLDLRWLLNNAAKLSLDPEISRTESLHQAHFLAHVFVVHL